MSEVGADSAQTNQTFCNGLQESWSLHRARINHGEEVLHIGKTGGLAKSSQDFWDLFTSAFVKLTQSGHSQQLDEVV